LIFAFLEILHAVERNRDINHTLMRHATGKIERLREQVEKADEQVAQSVATLQAAKKCILEERQKNEALQATVAQLRTNVDKIGLHLSVEERVRKLLDLKLVSV
jgi:hypothetical protein